MIPVIISKALGAAAVNNIAHAQTLAAAGDLTLTASPVVLDTPRRVLITSDGDDSGITFTVTGTNGNGQRIQEIVQGVSAAAVATQLDFLNVGTVAASDAVANHVTIGTNGTGSTDWKNPNWHLTPFSIELDSTVTSGTATYAIEYTMDDYYSPVPATAATPIPRVRSTAITAATTDTQINLNNPIRGWRMTITNGTGTVQTEAIQAGITNF